MSATPPTVEIFPFLSGVRSTGLLDLFEVVHQSTSGQGKMYGSDIRQVFPLKNGPKSLVNNGHKHG